MVWSGGMPLGLFKGERGFTLTPQPAFDAFAADLKKRAESG